MKIARNEAHLCLQPWPEGTVGVEERHLNKYTGLPAWG
jgi:hypothetical protein